jgi:hypothetical protein
MKPKRYTTAAAFRRALEGRLQEIAGEKVDSEQISEQILFAETIPCCATGYSREEHRR